MKNGLIEKIWLTYRDVAIHPLASDVQIEETRRAFFSGAMAVFYELLRKVSRGDKITDNDMKLMDELEAELQEFINQQVARMKAKQQ